MSRVTIAVIATALLVLISGFYLLPRLTESRLSTAPSAESAAPVDLGVTYLPITPGLSAYYDLGVDSGALVTEVAPNSPADRAGVRAGDIILSFNGVRVEAEISLLGVMRACPANCDIVLEVCRGKSNRLIQLLPEVSKEAYR